MPRLPRFDLPGYPLHVVQRGNNRQAVFFEDSDYRAYLDWLKVGARHYEVAVHAWCLMTNHVHLLVTPQVRQAVPRLFAYLGRHYVSYINHLYGRTGSLWEGRYRAALVDSQGYLLACHRYIELNPVRAGMVGEPSSYRWSSYRVNALGLPSALVTPHEVYRSLGSTAALRFEAYRGLFEAQLGEEMVTQIEAALLHNHVLGNERFKAEVERMLKRRLGRGGPGRPRKVGKRRSSDAALEDAQPRRGSQHRLL